MYGGPYTYVVYNMDELNYPGASGIKNLDWPSNWISTFVSEYNPIGLLYFCAMMAFTFPGGAGAPPGCVVPGPMAEVGASERWGVNGGMK